MANVAATISTDRYGTFAISLRSISWTQKPNVAESVNENVEQRTIWALVEVLQSSGQPIDSFWFSNDDVNVMTKCVDLTADRLDSTSQLDFIQSSRPVPLTKEALRVLTSAMLRITVYNGSSRVRETDAYWGEQRVSFLPAIIGERVHETVRLVGGVNQQEEVAIELSIQCDTDLADFTLGARVLQLQSFAIVSPPPEWSFSCETNQDAIDACASPERNTASYELELNLPEFNNDNDRSISFETIKFSGGKLTFEPSQAVFDTEVDATLNGTWSIVFSSVHHKLYVQSTVARLLDFIQVEKKMTGKLRRLSVELAGRVTTSIQIRLEDLATAGRRHLQVNIPFKKMAPFPKESLEQELAAATANDEKRRLQALVADYENAFVLPAKNLTNSISKATTRLEGMITILNTPLIPDPPPTPLPTKTIDELIPPRDLSEEYDQRKDVLKELRTEIRRVVLILLQEFENLDSTTAPSQDDKRRWIIYKLNTQGSYHSFKEKLKKRIIPLIRDQFAKLDENGVPNNQKDALVEERTDHIRANDKKKEYFAQLYAKFMDEVHTILHQTFYSNSYELEETYDNQQPRDMKKISETLMALSLKTMESEVNGDVEKCDLLHLDRIAFAEARAVEYPALAAMIVPSVPEIWLDYAKFCIRQHDFDKAGGALRQCLSLDANNLPALLVYAGLLCELQDFTSVEDVLKSAVHTALAAQDATSTWKELVTAHAILALYFKQCGRDPTGNLTLFELLRAKKVLSLHRNNSVVGQTSLSSVWIHLSATTHELGLHNITQLSLDLADEYHELRDVLTLDERVHQRTIQAKLMCICGNSDRGSMLLREALDLDPSHSTAWLVLGEAHLEQQGAHGSQKAVECLTRAMEHKSKLRLDHRLKLFVRLGLTLLQAAQYTQALDIFLLASEEFPTASSWLGVGIASLRLEQWDGTRVALAEANRLDASNPEVWGYLALLVLSEPSHFTAEREPKAKQFVAQAIRHQLSNPVLLRELSNGFIAIDRLEDAEALLRRSLVSQDSPITRKTLADVLAAQNCAQAALSQYKQALDDPNQNVASRAELLELCAVQLVTLGRQAEADEYRQMAKQFLDKEHIEE